MATATTQSQTVAMINESLGLIANVQLLYKQVVDFNRRNTEINPAQYWANFPTAPINSDGSLGAADATPNAAHPMTLAGLNRAISANALFAANSALLTDFQSFIDNQATYTAKDRRPNMDVNVGG